MLSELVRTWQAVAATRSRLAKTALLAECAAALPEHEIVPGVAFLCGELRQRQIGVGWAAVREVPPPAEVPTLTVAEVDAAFAEIGAMAGTGSVTRRRERLAALLGRATTDEQLFLRQLLVGEVRQGALAGVMADAVARAAEVPASTVRRAVLLSGDLRAVAVAALTAGAAGLGSFRLQVGRPLAPMLAQTADDLATALERTGTAAVEEKLDGARVQVHRSGGDVRVFTRSLDDITDRLPEVVDAVRAAGSSDAVFDGEVIALRDDGRPQPFQVTAARVGSRSDVEQAWRATPLTPFFFDALHLDGADLLDLPGSDRYAALAAALPAELLVRRVVTDEASVAEAFFADTLRRGHEGVMVKSLAAPYEAGRRGAGWVKVKPRHTLDLVVLAAEWGHGRRRGWLSNLHLGARDPDGTVGEPGGFVMLGKTFKGLTDEMLRWQTQRLLELEVRRDDWTVWVRPELVVEIAFDGVQTSPRYPGGVALRFARVKGYRTDKSPADADTLAAVLAHHPNG